MTRRCRVGASAVLVAVAVLFLAPAVRAQQVRVTTPTGQLGAVLDGTWSTAGGGRDARFTQFSEWLDLGVSGSVADPRLFSFTAQARPTWVQASGRSLFDSASAAGTSRFGSYAVSTSLFSIMPVAGNAWLTRTSGRSPDLFGVASAFDVRRRGGRLRLRRPEIGIMLDLERVARVDSQVRTGSAVLTRHDVVTEVGIRAQNSKLSASLRHQSADDRQGTADQASWIGEFSHRFTWGKGSSLASNVSTLSRSGFRPVQQARWEERVRLRHTRAVSTSWGYSQFATAFGGLHNSGNTYQGGVATDWPRDWQLGLDGRVVRNDFTSGSRSDARVVPRFAWQRRLSETLRMRLNASLGYEWLHQRTTSGAVVVLDERHVVSATRTFRLDQPFIDTATVTVTDVSQVTVYQAGADYRVVAVGELTEIVVLPVGRIALGDTVLVDYQYAVGPTGRSNGVVATYGGSLEWRPVQVYVTRDQRAPQHVEGRPLVLRYDYVTLGVAAVGTKGVVSATGRAEFQHRTFNGTDIDVQSLGGTVSAVLARALTGSFALGLSRQRGDVPLDNFRGDLTLGWTPSGQLRLGVRGTWWAWHQRAVRRESFLGGGVDVEWRVGQLRTRLAYSRGWWENTTDNVQDLLSLGVVRGF